MLLYLFIACDKYRCFGCIRNLFMQTHFLYYYIILLSICQEKNFKIASLDSFSNDKS